MDTFEKEMKRIKTNKTSAKEDFEKVLFSLENKSPNELSDEELRCMALSYMNLFFISQMRDEDKAERAITSFEQYFQRNYQDVDMIENYITTLELTYQYEKSRETLLQLANQKHTKSLALKFLSSYVYCANGLQSVEDCIKYKEQLIQITDNQEDKNRLISELSLLKKE